MVTRYVVIDKGWDLQQAATQASRIAGADLSFRTIPTGRPDLQTPVDGLAVQVDPAAVRAFVTEQFSASTPASSPTPTARQPRPRPATATSPPAPSATPTKRDHRGRRALRQLTARAAAPGADGRLPGVTDSFPRRQARTRRFTLGARAASPSPPTVTASCSSAAAAAPTP